MQRDLTGSDICEQFDIDERTLRRWLERGCPCDGKGTMRRFDADEVAAWMKANNLTGAMGAPLEPSGPISDQLKAAKLRKELAMAEKHEIALAREKGVLVESAKVEANNVQKFNLIRNKLMAIPAAAAFLVGKNPVEIERELETRIKEVLADLSKS